MTENSNRRQTGAATQRMTSQLLECTEASLDRMRSSALWLSSIFDNVLCILFLCGLKLRG